MNRKRIVLFGVISVVALLGAAIWFFNYTWNKTQEKALSLFEQSLDSDRMGVFVYVPENTIGTVYSIGEAVSQEYLRFNEAIDMQDYRGVGSSSFTGGNEYPFTFDSFGIEIPASQFTGYFEISARMRSPEDYGYEPDSVSKTEDVLGAIKARLEAEWGEAATIVLKRFVAEPNEAVQ